MLETRALAILNQYSIYGRPLEYHCIRLAEFAVALGKHRGVPFDEDLIRAACYLHDIGLCVKDAEEPNYLKRGAKFVFGQVEDWQLTAEQAAVLEDALLYNHSLKSIPNIQPQAELIRLAVSVEHTFGRMTHGLDRAFIRSVFEQYPRTGFNRVLLSFFKIAILDDSLKELARVWFPTIETSHGAKSR